MSETEAIPPGFGTTGARIEWLEAENARFWAMLEIALGRQAEEAE